MDNEQLDIVYKLIAKSDGMQRSPYMYLIHATFYTLDIVTLSELFICTKDKYVKKSLESHLSRRVTYDDLNLKPLFNHLLRKNKKAPYHEHQRIRLLLSKFIQRLPKSYIQKYFDLLSSTGYIHDLSAAIDVADIVWNSEFDDTFISEYISTGNVKYLEAVLKNGKTKSIIERLPEIWEEEPFNYVKNRLIRKIAPTHFHVLEFLKNKEPDKYLYASSIGGYELDDKEAIELIGALSEYQKPYGLWCLGKLGKWNLLKGYLEEYIR